MAIDERHAGIVLMQQLEKGICRDQITLISGEDGQRISIPRLLLSAISNYYRVALGPLHNKEDKTEFTLDNTSGEEVKAIVQFCYTGLIDLTEENVEKYLAISSFHQIDLLKAKCCQFYADKLSAKNAISSWIAADKYLCQDIRQKAFNLVCESFKSLPSSDILVVDHRLIQELLQCDRVQASEELIFKRLVEWFGYKEGEREQCMPELLALIRLEHISSQFIDARPFVEVFQRFNRSGIIVNERKRRAASGRTFVDVKRRYGMFYLLVKHTTCKTVIRVEKYSSALNCFQEAAEIVLADRRASGAVMQKDQIYILGGFKDMYFKSVFVYDLSTGISMNMPDMSLARCNFSSLLFGKYIFVFGGYTAGRSLNTCERFDTEAKAWQLLEPMNVARRSASVAVLNEYIYIAGGAIEKELSTSSVELYDPEKDDWILIAPMNHGRCNFALVRSNGFLYAIGGHAATERYDPWRNRWEVVESFDESDLIERSTEVDGKTVAIMRDGRFGHINFDTEAKAWQLLEPMNVARRSASVAVLNEYIYIAGGAIDKELSTSSVELYDPEKDEWILIAPMNHGRCNFALVRSNGFLYAIGGHAATERYDPWRNRWEVVESFDESDLIERSTEVDGKTVAIMRDGRFGHIKFVKNGGCLFHPLCTMKYESGSWRTLSLCQS